MTTRNDSPLRAAVLHALSAPGAPTQAAVARAVTPVWGVSTANATTTLNAWLRGKRKSIPLRVVEAVLTELGLAVVPQPKTGAP